MRKVTTYELSNANGYKYALFKWAKEFSHSCYLDSCHAINTQLNSQYYIYDCIVAVGNANDILIRENYPDATSLGILKKFHSKNNDWLFGFLSYDIKNEIEVLDSTNKDGLQFPLLHFFIPKIVFLFKQSEVQIGFLEDFYTVSDIGKIHKQLLQLASPPSPPEKSGQALQRGIFRAPLHMIFESKISKSEYINGVNMLKAHIQQGDIYEANFCQEFYAKVEHFNPELAYWNLKKISPTPFSAYYHLNDYYLMCASPERFLLKQGNKILSQPIKGTIKRGVGQEEDDKLKMQLMNDTKERAENIMIVDLVRNDLSKIAQKSSTKVEELCNIYSYEQVHQMVSSISCLLHKEYHFTDAIKACFPMGSMTGAPKIKAMELIEKYESTKRGLFSGSVGYITAEGDFDFNVVIRSLLYNQANNYLSFMVGSAITIQSDPEKEYEECLLKAQALLGALAATINFR